MPFLMCGQNFLLEGHQSQRESVNARRSQETYNLLALVHIDLDNLSIQAMLSWKLFSSYIDLTLTTKTLPLCLSQQD